MFPDFDSAKEYIENNKSSLRTSFASALKDYERKMFFPSFRNENDNFYARANEQLRKDGL